MCQQGSASSLLIHDKVALRYGNMEMLQWLRDIGCWPGNSTCCAQAAENGHLDVLQWLRANGCPWNERTCAVAEEKGHLEVLQWALANGCPEYL